MLRKLQRFEQSLFEAKLATPGSPFTESPYGDENFKFCEIFFIPDFFDS